jgi:hypothetical protein
MSSSSSPQDAAPQAPGKAGRVSRVRQLVPLVALLIVLGGEIVEVRARGSAAAAYARIERAFGGEGDRQALLPSEVHQIIGRSADEFDQTQGTEIYRWRGSLQTHAVYVRFQWHAGKIYATDFSLDNDLRSGRGTPRVALPAP